MDINKLQIGSCLRESISYRLTIPALEPVINALLLTKETSSFRGVRPVLLNLLRTTQTTSRILKRLVFPDMKGLHN
jgi:hypothetical protein